MAYYLALGVNERNVTGVSERPLNITRTMSVLYLTLSTRAEWN
ncbi:MAG TPA: hypothetical protein VE971_02200 [Candidatus Eisenbacteria bacterium]|nr:hypothetical protein [Candidatus Eisenbacteria bacterium]